MLSGHSVTAYESQGTGDIVMNGMSSLTGMMSMDGGAVFWGVKFWG